MSKQRSFLHLSYSYGYGFDAQIAMQDSLANNGRDKVGFSVIGKAKDGQPIYLGHLRGLVERNTMRYYLALEACLGALSGTAAEQQEQRLKDWQTAVEGYPLQLHELERSEYLAMKHRGIRRQKKPLVVPPLTWVRVVPIAQGTVQASVR